MRDDLRTGMDLFDDAEEEIRRISWGGRGTLCEMDAVGLLTDAPTPQA